MIAVEQLTDSCTYHGEGPVWDAAAGLLRWVDLLAGDVLSLSPSAGGTPSRLRVGQVAAAVRPRHHGGLVIAVERGFTLLDPGASEPRPLPELWSDASVRMNDGACDPQGRFYCGSMPYDGAAGRGALYRLDGDGSTHRVLAGVTISNGLVWSNDGSTVFYIDSPTQRVDAFDFDPRSGAFSGRRTVVEIPPEHGMPDGMAIDADGGLWVALWGGGAVHRYLPDGRLDAIVELPVRQVTACAFGGESLGDLFISTSRMDIPDREQPGAGALFHAVPGVAGLPAAAFDG
ncbi:MULTISPECIES: SMP-30/gluconolactonase/LRE family protein [Streptomyces]|uniref:SMP-30/gluconolactonase/LRE family protein n=1 Tax=Streptomyces TaxID=1883 RepID=UPI003435F090